MIKICVLFVNRHPEFRRVRRPKISTETEDPQSFKPETKEPESVDPRCRLSGGERDNATARKRPLSRLQQVPGNEPRAHSRVRTQERISLASKVGVCMSPKRFATLRFRLPQIEERVKQQREGAVVGDDLKIHIGGPLYVTVSQGYSCVNFRKFFYPTGEAEPKPSQVWNRTPIMANLSSWWRASRNWLR